jgi:hypothetical protein
MAMSWMYSAQCLETIFTEFFTSSEKLARVHDRKLSITAILRIFSSQELWQNQQVRQSLPNLMKALIFHLKELPRAEEHRKEMEKMNNGTEDSDDEDEDESEMTNNSDDFAKHRDDTDDEADIPDHFDDDDVEDLEGQEYLDKLERFRQEQGDDDDEGWFDELQEEMDVESRMDNIDVYSVFYQAMEG